MADRKYSRDQNRKSQRERIQEISEELERGVQSMFESEQYKKWLDVCSRFHSYSLNNTILITMQRPDASYVGSFGLWKKLGRSVKKGEHGIRILAPYKYKIEVEDSNGDKQIIEKIGFKPAYVFDLSQTEGKELPTIGVNELTGDVKEYRRLFRALTEISPVPIRFEDIPGGAKGYYNDAEKCIALQSGMSQLQTIKTLVHEVVHGHNHSKEALKERPDVDRKSMEVESLCAVSQNVHLFLESLKSPHFQKKRRALSGSEKLQCSSTVNKSSTVARKVWPFSLRYQPTEGFPFQQELARIP